MSTKKLDLLKRIELDIQKLWDEEKIYEADLDNCTSKQTAFVTFPYPYMNGRLHLGHAFSVSKSEFAARFFRLQNLNVLFPFAFHCTGMPICASADKIKYELIAEKEGSDYSKLQTSCEKMTDTEEDIKTKKNLYVAKKSKSLAKIGTAKTQTEILLQLNVDPDDIPKFVNPEFWIKYFVPRAIKDSKKLGLAIDWRRSFVTTSCNPYYDMFIKWQFTTLYNRKKIVFGLRPTIFSRKEQQPCADHDRSSGESVVPVKTLILKIKIEDKTFLNDLKAQTGYDHASNTYLLVTIDIDDVDVLFKNVLIIYDLIEYGLYPAFSKFVVDDLDNTENIRNTAAQRFIDKSNLETECDEFYICSNFCATNLSYQGRIASLNSSQIQPHQLIGISADQLCNLKIINPSDNTKQLNIINDKIKKLFHGTGIDWNREKSDKEIDKSEKKLDNWLDKASFFDYYHTTEEVISRSGDSCIVALCNQWYMDYGNKEWKKKVIEHVVNPKSFNSYGQQNTFVNIINWLDGWACSRNYGLGTYLPWEEEKGKKIVIESLSDSTIYFAYYTISHLLQGDVYGKTPGILNIKPEELTVDVFDYIYFQTDTVPQTSIERTKLDDLRNNFYYWYPMNLRCSGKDLINNHLVMSLYHHAAIWPNKPELWPKAFFVNGFLMLDSKKMSKQTGNFLSLEEAVDKFGVDSTRLALAESGDTTDDANFEQKTAIASIMKLYNFLQIAQDIVDIKGSLNEKYTELDYIFLSQTDYLNKFTYIAYTNIIYRDSVKYAFHDNLSLHEFFKTMNLPNNKLSKQAQLKWLETTLIMLAPIIPHCSDYVWRFILKKPNSIVNTQWPGPLLTPSEFVKSNFKYNMLDNLIFEIRKSLEKTKKINKSKNPQEINNIEVCVSKIYSIEKQIVLDIINSHVKKEIFDNVFDTKPILNEIKSNDTILQMIRSDPKSISSILAFASYKIKSYFQIGDLVLTKNLPFDELQFYEQFDQYFNRIFKSPVIFKETMNADVFPGKPSVTLSFKQTKTE